MKKSLSSLLCLFITVAFFSCSEDKEKEIALQANIVGVWTVESADFIVEDKSLEDYVAGEIAERNYSEAEIEDRAINLAKYVYSGSVWVGSTFEFKEDNTVIVTEPGKTEHGTWSIDGNSVSISLKDDFMPRVLKAQSISSNRATWYVKYDEESVYTDGGIEVTMEWKK